MIYETREARVQADRERTRLAAVSYLRQRIGSEVEVGVIAKSIGVAATHLGRVVSASPMTFRSRRVHRTRNSDVVVVELHPHLRQP